MSRLLTTTVLALAAAAAMAPAAHAAPPVVAAVGDIACDPRDPSFNDGAGTADRCRQSVTADVVARGPVGDNSSAFAAVLTLGDEQYDCGSPANFSASYDEAWGRFGALVWPVPGNHEYKGWSQFGGSGCQADGSGYYDYFGARASGVNGKGYYSFDIGAWHVIALNSNCRKVGGCDSGSPQETWLRRDLAATGDLCTLAYMHHPAWSSAKGGGTSAVRPLWADLTRAGVDLVLAGHAHQYERFSDLSASGAPVAAGSGTREMVVGTGGENLMRFATARAGSQVRNSTTFGVLSLTLSGASYSWRYLTAAGGPFSDTGTTACH